MFIIAAVLFLLAIGLFVWEYLHWMEFLPTIIGVNLVLASLRLVQWAYNDLQALRDRERRSASL